MRKVRVRDADPVVANEMPMAIAQVAKNSTSRSPV